jgi:hypothetical protein
MHDVIARYLDCWNETDPAARRKLIGEVWAPDAEYSDPMAEAHGRDAIDATIGAVQDQFPGLVFTLAGPVDAHHRQARFTWVSGRRAVSPSSSASTWPSPPATARSFRSWASWTRCPPDRCRLAQSWVRFTSSSPAW